MSGSSQYRECGMIMIGMWAVDYIGFPPAGPCWRRISPRTWTCPLDSCTSRIHPSTQASRPRRRPPARIEVVARSMHGWLERGGLLTRVRASLVMTAAHLRRPRPVSIVMRACFPGPKRLYRNRRIYYTPLTRSKINLIATQNSSKSRLPSLSTSARSHTLSS